MDPTLVQFGRNLRHYRRLRQLSQEELADMSDVHRTSISKYERAKTWPGLEALVKLSRALALPSVCNLIEELN